MLYLVTQMRTTVKSTVGWRPGDVREWLRKSFQGEHLIQDKIGPVPFEIRAAEEEARKAVVRSRAQRSDEVQPRRA